LVFENYLSVALKIKDNVIIEFTDTLIEKGKLDFFIRKLKNQDYIFINGKLIFKKIKKTKNKIIKFKGVIPEGFINNKILTMDLKTRTIEGIMIPYCISTYDGKRQATSFYLSDYKDSDEMLTSAIKSIVLPKYHNHKIYFS
jgi:hypothetical protein